MEIENTFISGLKIIHLKEFKDVRGSFIKIFNDDFFRVNSLETNFKESYYSISSKNIIRGMHYQIPPAEHIKIVYINNGSILDVILDIRHNSPTFGQYYELEINMDNPILVYIPVGCAHGFLSMEDHTIVTYLQSSCYNPLYDKGIKYNSFGMNWGVNSPILSARDLDFPDFSSDIIKF